MLERIRHMLIKEFIQVLRDPRMRGVIFLAPIFQLLILSYAITTDIRNISMAVFDQDRTVASRQLVERFSGSGYFVIEHRLCANRRSGNCWTARAPRSSCASATGFGRDLSAGRSVIVQAILDGTDSNTASVILQYAGRVIAAHSRQVQLEAVRRQAGPVVPAGHIELQPRAWFNPNLESRLYYVPGFIAIIVTLVTLMLTSMAVVREKEIGTMEQLLVSPITPWEFILGKSVPFAIIAFADVILATTVGVLWFDVPVRGSLLLLFLATCIYLLSAIGIGLLISTISRTQQQAMMTTFFFFMPAIMLSGFMFPIANMPEVIQWITYANPLRYFLVIIRELFLKGVGLSVLWPQMAALGVIGLITIGFATCRFKKPWPDLSTDGQKRGRPRNGGRLTRRMQCTVRAHCSPRVP